MELNESGVANCIEWIKKGYKLPNFDHKEMMKRTKENPRWIHFGAGNIFRAYHANLAQELLDQKKIDTGIIVVEGFDYEIIEKMNRQHDEYSILVTLKASGDIEKKVIGSIAESCILDSENIIEFNRLKEIFQKPSLQIATFTITEKGYCLNDSQGKILDSVEYDFNHGPNHPRSYIGKVCSLLYVRYQNNKLPITLMSTDNCSHNGEKLFNSVKMFVTKWVEKRFVEKEFLNYIEDTSKVSFPWTMIDKITPRPDEKIRKLLEKDQIDGLDSYVTSKKTYVAPFVNAEECEYLVAEQNFPAGIMPLNEVGVMFTNRNTVDKVEKMKVCTCLNPLHTALAIFGCLLNYKLIADEMKDVLLNKLVHELGYKEGLPVVIDPKILEPKKFLETVLETRIPNPFMPDTPQRIATDTSEKLAIRYGETIKAYISNPQLNVKELKIIPLVFAGWIRYLMGIDDNGNYFELSPDPIIKKIKNYIEDIKFGVNENIVDKLKPILKNKHIFGVDLFEVGLDQKVCDYFIELNDGKGAVRKTLEKYIL